MYATTTFAMLRTAGRVAARASLARVAAPTPLQQWTPAAPNVRLALRDHGARALSTTVSAPATYRGPVNLVRLRA